MITVLVVDDSAVVRQVLGDLITAQPDMSLFGTAADPLFAMQRMSNTWPDVVVLDIEMPRMDGLTYLRQLMSEHPLPVVICSSLTERGTSTALQALAAGAVEVVAKPSLGVRDYLTDHAVEILSAIRVAAAARPRLAPPGIPLSTAPIKQLLGAGPSERMCAIGASTGGTQVLETLLQNLRPECPGVAIVQHMPAGFTDSFARRLDSISSVDVREAADGDAILPGRVLIAPGGRQFEVLRVNGALVARVFAAPSVNRHCPSVDVLFQSVARHVGRQATGVLLTGMGADGAIGLKAMRDAGARTVAQDEASCVVFGMPKEAIRLGGAEIVAGIDQIGQLIAF